MSTDGGKCGQYNPLRASMAVFTKVLNFDPPKHKYLDSWNFDFGIFPSHV